MRPTLNVENNHRLALSLGLESVEYIDKIDHFSQAISYASSNCWRNFQRLVQPNEIVVPGAFGGLGHFSVHPRALSHA
jgi:hypothetical protein